jgi:dTDP-4-dehydrorhamnose 3,5-epimerase
MLFKPTSIAGMFTITLEPREDERGYFARQYCQNEFTKAGITDYRIVQINQAKTKIQGAVRGLHWQTAPKEEAKIFQCLEGEIFDVVADIRPDSPSFGKWLGVKLIGGSSTQLFIPKGVAHGYQVLSKECRVQYLVSEFYAPETERGIRYNDPLFTISWPAPVTFVTPKDQNWPDFKK